MWNNWGLYSVSSCDLSFSDKNRAHDFHRQKCDVVVFCRNAGALLSNIIVFGSLCALFGPGQRTMNTARDEWKFMASTVKLCRPSFVIVIAQASCALYNCVDERFDRRVHVQTGLTFTDASRKCASFGPRVWNYVLAAGHQLWSVSATTETLGHFTCWLSLDGWEQTP